MKSNLDMTRKLLILFLLGVACSCGDDKIDTAKAKAEMEAREIKKVSEAEIVEEAFRLGRELKTPFEIKIDSNGFYSVYLGQDEKISKAHYFLDSTYRLKGKALGIFEAYQYNLENGINSEDIVQKLDDKDTFLYTSPSFFNDQNVGIWAIRFSRKELVLNFEQ